MPGEHGMPNLDAMDPADLQEAADMFEKLRDFALAKFSAMTHRAAGHVGVALEDEARCDRIYKGLPEAWRW